MKKRSMILALASMLGVSAAATAVSGFAWFTAQTTADIKAGEFYVGAATGNLKITKNNANDINCTSSCENNSMTVTPTDAAFADVSSIDGKTFYKLSNLITKTGSESADVVTENGKNTTTKKWMSKVNSAQMVAVEWTVTVANEGNSPAMDVYLSNNGAIFKDKVASDGHSSNAESLESKTSYVDAYRLAIFKVGESSDTPVFFYSETTNGITSADKGTGDVYAYTAEKGWDGTGMASGAKHATKTTVKTIKSTSDTASSDAEGTLDCQLLINDLGTDDVTLRFVVWCEGTDTPEKTVDSLNKVEMSLGLIGLTA